MLEHNVSTAEDIEVKILETKTKMDNGKCYHRNEYIGESQLFRLSSENVLVVPNLRINPMVKVFDVNKKEWTNIFSIKTVSDKQSDNAEYVSNVFKDNTFLFGISLDQFKLLGGNRDR